jgi:hypothetical protein
MDKMMKSEMDAACMALRNKMARMENRAPRLSWNKKEEFEAVQEKCVSRLVIAR